MGVFDGLEPDPVMGNTPLVEVPRNMIYGMVRDQLEAKHVNAPEFTVHDVFVVWFSKTLQNWKALVATTLPEELYYEVTYNGDKKEVYIDTYMKLENRAFPVVEDVNG